MFKPLAVLIGLGALTLGAANLDAQSSFRGDRSIERNNGRSENRRTKVWVEDFEMVEERYQEAGFYRTVERQVWVPEAHVTVTEQVLVPETHVTTIERVLVPAGTILVEEEVFVPGRNITIREAHVMRNGRTHYINRVKWEPAHYEMQMVERCVPAHYENREVTRCIPAHYETRETVKCIPGHYKTVCEQEYVPGCFKTRLVKKCIGGHYEVRFAR
jgi:hypothetical protein